MEGSVVVAAMEEIENSPAPVSITSLPFEILSEIFNDPALKLQDLKNIRLAGAKQFILPANERLFLRIRISRLIKDRDAFISIANSPHLAGNVKELVWEEISWDMTMFPELSPGLCAEIGDQRQVAQLELASIRQNKMLEREAGAIFWFPIAHCMFPYNSEIHSIRQRIIRDFGIYVLLPALRNFPKLHTFLSRPMDHSRVLGYFQPLPHPRYIHDALASGPHFIGTTAFSYSAQDLINLTNDGLFEFLQHVMRRPGPGSPIKHLKWGEEYHIGTTRKTIHPGVMAHLESLEICFSSEAHTDVRLATLLGVTERSMCAALREAANLRHVKFCVHYGDVWPVSHRFSIEQGVHHTLWTMGPLVRMILWNAGLEHVEVGAYNWWPLPLPARATMPADFLDLDRREPLTLLMRYLTDARVVEECKSDQCVVGKTRGKPRLEIAFIHKSKRQG